MSSELCFHTSLWLAEIAELCVGTFGRAWWLIPDHPELFCALMWTLRVMGEKNGSSALISHLENDIQKHAHALLCWKVHSISEKHHLQALWPMQERKKAFLSSSTRKQKEQTEHMVHKKIPVLVCPRRSVTSYCIQGTELGFHSWDQAHSSTTKKHVSVLFCQIKQKTNPPPSPPLQHHENREAIEVIRCSRPGRMRPRAAWSSASGGNPA